MLAGSLAEVQGFDALGAYELRGVDGAPIRFGLARKWSGDAVNVLSWVVEPEAARDLAFLLLRRPGRRPEVISSFGRFPSGAPPASGNAFSIGAEVAGVTLAGDFSLRLRTEERLEGEPCHVVEGRPLRRMRGVTHVVWWISQETGLALRKSYYWHDREQRTVTLVPEAVRTVGGRRIPHLWRVATLRGTQAEIELHDVAVDVLLPDSVFSLQNLRAQRFPSL